MDLNWVHCNNCFKEYQDLSKDQSMFCTSCGHIFCSKCLQETCLICNRNFETAEIGDKMPYNLRIYFDNIHQIIQRLPKVIKFQFEHRTRLENNKSQVFSQIAKLSKQKEKLEEDVSTLTKEIEKEKEELKKMQTLITRPSNFKTNISMANCGKRNCFSGGYGSEIQRKGFVYKTPIHKRTQTQSKLQHSDELRRRSLLNRSFENSSLEKTAHFMTPTKSNCK